MSRLQRTCIFASLLSVTVLASTLTVAAPKPGSTKRSSASGPATHVKWEHCFVVAGASSGNKQGVLAYLPQGRKLFVPSSPDGYAAIAQMLNRLGEQGWQVVGYQDTSTQSYIGQSWTLSRRK